MEYLKDLFEKKHISQLLLVILFIVYLIMGYKMPEGVANMIDTPVGKIIVSLVSLLLFAYSNPILGVLGIIVAYELIKRSSIKTGSAALEEYYPTEEKKWSPFTPAHQFPYTLEQEVVKKMAPQKFNKYPAKASFKPLLDDLHDAAPANFTGPI